MRLRTTLKDLRLFCFAGPDQNLGEVFVRMGVRLVVSAPLDFGGDFTGHPIDPIIGKIE